MSNYIFAAATPAAGGILGQFGQLGTILPFILIFVVFYFFLIMPQKKKEKQLKAMIDAMKVGDEILTIGGVYGKITRIKDDVVFIESTTDKTKLQIARWSVKDVTKYVEDMQ